MAKLFVHLPLPLMRFPPEAQGEQLHLDHTIPLLTDQRKFPHLWHFLTILLHRPRLPLEQSPETDG